MHMPITALYAALLALIFFFLSFRTVRMRGKLRIAIGDAGNAEMTRAMRVHANFAEYVPFTVLLIYFAEVGGANAYLVHGLGLCLLLGRLSHAYGVSQTREKFAFRVSGMVMTFIPLLLASGYIVGATAARLNS
jgi:uncharacterized membrane protein YecN with MAPEG domain